MIYPKEPATIAAP